MSASSKPSANIRTDPADANNARMIDSMFIANAQDDIRRKLQKTQGALAMPISQLLEIAF